MTRYIPAAVVIAVGCVLSASTAPISVQTHRALTLVEREYGLDHGQLDDGFELFTTSSAAS